MNRTSRTSRVLLFAGVSLLLGGCAKRVPDATPDEIPALQAALAASPEDTEVATRLGVALYRAGDYRASRDILSAATADGDVSGAAWLYLGLANEGLEEWTPAREAYQGYLDRGRDGPLLDEIQDRLRLMVRRELEAQAADAVAAEARLSNTPPAPRSIAVLPFQLIGDAPELDPLRVALADMMITDLAVSNALTVLERTRIQTLLDEIAMTEAGLTDEATGARAGRLLQAEHVVQGALTTVGSDAIRFDGDVLNTTRAASAGQLENQDQLAAIFDLEKAAVFQVLDVLGVELTPAERQAIDENRSDNLLAFLAYGQGLQAVDRGDYAAANGFFNQAMQLDPGFVAAQTQNSESSSLQSASETSSDAIADQGASEMDTDAVSAPPEESFAVSLETTLVNVNNGVNPSPTSGQIDLGNTSTGGDDSEGSDGTTREPVQESGGSEGRAEPTTVRIKITITRPGSGGGL